MFFNEVDNETTRWDDKFQGVSRDVGHSMDEELHLLKEVQKVQD